MSECAGQLGGRAESVVLSRGFDADASCCRKFSFLICWHPRGVAAVCVKKTKFIHMFA